MNKNTQRLLGITGKFPGKKIAVWGDFLLDEYIYGNTRRISREAPVLVLSYKNSEYALGGAGNALLNILSLGAEPIPIGVIGQDESGNHILEILKRTNIAADHLIVHETYITPLKTRILAGEASTRKQQILRIDRESLVPDDKHVQQGLLRSLKTTSDSAHGLLISDYHYFTVKTDIFTQVLKLFESKTIPVSLDSRFRLLDFHGVTISTPNEPEVEEALNLSLEEDDRNVRKAGISILDKTQAHAVLITRGSHGMTLFEQNKTEHTIPIHGSPDIVDVTGAGDTVISVFTLALTCGANFIEAAELANYAGGIVVMKKGTATLELHELQEAIKTGR